MTLGKKQERFTRMLLNLLAFIYTIEGHEVRLGDAFRDPRVHGDKWIMSLTGDCEDFSLFSYFYLVGKGYEPQFWLVRTETDEMHTVLVVDGYEFDNRRKLRLRKTSDYKYIVEIKIDALRRTIKNDTLPIHSKNAQRLY